MEQDEINHKEWEDPNNWKGTLVGKFYNSKKDTRKWVPNPSNLGLRKIPNFAYQSNVVFVTAVVWIPVTLFIVLAVFMFLNG